MLKEIYIENLATIEKAVIKPGAELNVLTGETGAGKSILIGSINGILGQRVYKDIVRAGAEKAIIIATFDALPAKAKKLLNDNGFDIEDEDLILQREISADGKSSARINGKPATAALLRDVGSELIDIHGQHDNRLLMSVDNQRDILDNFGGLENVLSGYRENFKMFSQLSKRIRTLQLSQTEKNEKEEMLSYQIEELQALNFQPGEEAKLAQKLAAAQNSAKIEEGLYAINTLLSGDDSNYDGAINMIVQAKDQLSNLVELIPDLNELVQRLDGIIIDLDDIRTDVASRHLDVDEGLEKLSMMEDRMSEILRAKRKYGMDVDEMIAHLEYCKDELAHLDDLDDLIEKLVENRKLIGESVKEQARNITKLRQQAAEKLVAEVSEQLKFLDMPDVRLVFDISPDKVTVHGMDRIEMLISVNKGEMLRPLHKVASGGELSRIMLAIKNVLADNDSVPTMIFDEVDTGISGRAAQKVGIKLSQAAKKRQTLCVTHLAQIAAKADTHILIEKTSDENRTFTNVKILDFDGRKREIARIIGGEISEASLTAAEEMLKEKAIV